MDTRVAHARVEGLLEPHLRSPDPGGYRQLVAALFGFIEPLEQRMAAHCRDQSLQRFVAARRHGGRLRADLAALAVDPAEAPRCTRLPAVDSVPAMFGCAYVLEGSTLGGRIISGWLAAALGLSAATGASYFAGYGAATGRMWRATRAALAVLPADAHGAVATAAADTFEALHDWLAWRLAPVRTLAACT